jgi:hypothetical protein
VVLAEAVQADADTAIAVAEAAVQAVVVAQPNFCQPRLRLEVAVLEDKVTTVEVLGEATVALFLLVAAVVGQVLQVDILVWSVVAVLAVQALPLQ